MRLQEKEPFYDAHMHIFDQDKVPNRMFGWGITPLAKSKIGGKIIYPFLKALSRVVDNPEYGRAMEVVNISGMNSEDIFLRGSRTFPMETKFVVTSIDLEFINAGKVNHCYGQQVEELAELSQKSKGKIIPLYHAHPERDLSVFRWAMENGFKGVKLYPAHGHRPDDERLIPIYEYCNNRSLPIMMHSGEQSPSHFKGSKKAIRRRLDVHNVLHTKGMNKAELCGQFGHPRYYEKLIKKYSNIKWIYGHWGSGKAWQEYLENNNSDTGTLFHEIKKQMLIYENVYADISYLIGNKKYWPAIKLQCLNSGILDKIIFGSDYYMVKILANQKLFSQEFRVYMGEEIWQKIAKETPKKVYDFGQQ